MSLIAAWIVTLIATAASGVWLVPGWLRRHLDPPQNRVIAHGGLGMLALALFFAGYTPDGAMARPQLVALVVVIATGAMMFGARRRERRCPRPLLFVHLAGCGGLLLSLLPALS